MRLLFVAAFLILVGCGPAPAEQTPAPDPKPVCVPLKAPPEDSPSNSSYANGDGRPPARFQRYEDAMVAFRSKERIQEICGPPPCGYVIQGCVKEGVVYVPHPCLDADLTDTNFTGVLCHELGHVSGWPSAHGE